MVVLKTLFVAALSFSVFIFLLYLVYLVADRIAGALSGWNYERKMVLISAVVAAGLAFAIVFAAF